MDTSQSAFLETMRRQFDFGPYPRHPIDQSPRNEPNELFVYNLVTPYYLRDQRVISTEGKLILDAGCGTGYKALTLALANPGARVVGVDISPKSVELAQQRLEHHGLKDSVELQVLAIEDLPQLGMAFDYINCDEVLYFFDDIARGLAALKSVLKPEGIIRANLHSALQRAIFFRAQELFGLMGLMEPDAEEMAIPIVVETMKALNGGIDLKKRSWLPKYETDDNAEALLANHLLQGDKGYRIADLFAALQKADLAFVSMLNWRHWEVADLFNEPDNLPAYLAMGLADSSIQDRLTLYELLHPVHRLLDFWCGHPSDTPSPTPLAEWDIATWQTAQVTLHPQLLTDKVRAAATEAIYKRQPLMLSEFLNLPTLNPVPVDSGVAALLLGLFNGPMAFAALVDHWRTLRSVDWVTLEPVSVEAAQQQVIEMLSSLETFLYVLVEPQP
ncbi:MAG: SAM-dependent methyltransferase [Shackletoniella antarctica]|uniref:SAM-dependent methyltransferase n=1 Tax=Shackletoniella antarctica TaxID=268115 RepID=A0A2W4W6C7_9CYAN|nr:MAG: SAM-dependent methyltransferase [Shackletoniella antarctica]